MENIFRRVHTILVLVTAVVIASWAGESFAKTYELKIGFVFRAGRAFSFLGGLSRLRAEAAGAGWWPCRAQRQIVELSPSDQSPTQPWRGCHAPGPDCLQPEVQYQGTRRGIRGRLCSGFVDAQTPTASLGSAGCWYLHHGSGCLGLAKRVGLSGLTPSVFQANELIAEAVDVREGCFFSNLGLQRIESVFYQERGVESPLHQEGG